MDPLELKIQGQDIKFSMCINIINLKLEKIKNRTVIQDLKIKSHIPHGYQVTLIALFSPLLNQLYAVSHYIITDKSLIMINLYFVFSS